MVEVKKNQKSNQNKRHQQDGYKTNETKVNKINIIKNDAAH